MSQKIGFIFNRHLGYESRDQMSTLDEKTRGKKISCKFTFSGLAKISHLSRFRSEFSKFNKFLPPFKIKCISIFNAQSMYFSCVTCGRGGDTVGCVSPTKPNHAEAAS
jgi:hypothetical protein